MHPQPHSTAFEVTILRDRGTITLIQTNGDTAIADGVDFDYGVWQRMLPHVARERKGIRRELIELRDGDAVSIPGDDQLRSLFNLAVILSSCTASPLVSRVSEAWMRIPLQSRAGWWHQANADKPIHAQILGVEIRKTLFDTQVPDWLPRLIAATDNVARGPGIDWAYARTPLGTTCIAYLDDDPENLHACMALSSCGIVYDQVDSKGGQLAQAAVDDLIRRSDLLTDSAFAGGAGWVPTGHEDLEMSATLDDWRKRVGARSSGGPGLT